MNAGFRQSGTDIEFGPLTVGPGLPGLTPGCYLALHSHSGSRGTGAMVCEHYSKLAMARHAKTLSEPFKRLAWLDLSSAEGQEYWAAMQLMGRYASANHALIHDSILRRFGAAHFAHRRPRQPRLEVGPPPAARTGRRTAFRRPRRGPYGLQRHRRSHGRPGRPGGARRPLRPAPLRENRISSRIQRRSRPLRVSVSPCTVFSFSRQGPCGNVLFEKPLDKRPRPGSGWVG